MSKYTTKEILRNSLGATALAIGLAACTETVTADISAAKPAPHIEITAESTHQTVTAPPLEYGALVASQNIQDIYKKIPPANRSTIKNTDSTTESGSIIRANGLKLYFSETYDNNNNITNVLIGQSEKDGATNDNRTFKLELAKSEQNTWQAECIAGGVATTVSDQEIAFTDGSKTGDQGILAQARGILDRTVGTVLGSTIADPENPVIPDDLGLATCQQIDALK